MVSTVVCRVNRQTGWSGVIEDWLSNIWKKFAIENYRVEPRLEYFYSPAAPDNTKNDYFLTKTFSTLL